MTTKTYNKRSNAVRAARSKLGKGAQEGKDFTIEQSSTEAGARLYAVKPVAQKSSRKASTSTKPACAHQPAMVALLKLAARKNGVSVAEAMEASGAGNHTIRGAFSRLSQEVDITKQRDARNVRYFHKAAA